MKLEVYATALKGENIYSANLSSTGLIVLGSEAKGVRDELKKYFSKTLFIPPYSSEKKSSADSLNVAVAAAIVCSEFRRRR
jgi:TrmH family RNA methyltransferase